MDELENKIAFVSDDKLSVIMKLEGKTECFNYPIMAECVHGLKLLREELKPKDGVRTSTSPHVRWLNTINGLLNKIRTRKGNVEIIF